MLGVVNTGRPLQVRYWGVVTPATPAALTPMHIKPTCERSLAALQYVMYSAWFCGDAIFVHDRLGNSDESKASTQSDSPELARI